MSYARAGNLISMIHERLIDLLKVMQVIAKQELEDILQCLVLTEYKINNGQTIHENEP